MFNSNFSARTRTSFASISSSAFLAEEGIVWDKGGSCYLLDEEIPQGIEAVKSLIEASEGSEFSPRRYQGLAAFYVSTGVLTLDWDLDETQHAADCIVEGVDSINDIIALLEQDIEFHPSHVWELQATRSGYHAVLLSECEVPVNIRDEWMLALGCDPLYVENLKPGLYDWRVTPKHLTDSVCTPVQRIGQGETLEEVEILLDLYYAAIEAVLDELKEDSDFLYLEEEQVEDKNVIEKVDNYLLSTNLYSDWYPPEVVFNPLTGEEVYTIRVYRKDKDNWWTRVSISL